LELFEFSRYTGEITAMSKVDQIEAQLEQLSPDELRQIRSWLDDVLEDERQFTPEFEASIRESEQEMAQGCRPRVSDPNARP
jgi:ubiquinone biosynthesis protein UbiJ